MRFLAAICALWFLSAPVGAQESAGERVVVTRQDLIDMTDADLPTSLIVKTVQAADEVPNLQPADLISLRTLGVAPEVLEAVVGHASPAPPASEPSAVPDPATEPAPSEQGPAAVSKAPEAPPAAVPDRRRVRVSARLESKRGWLRNPFGSSDDGGFAVYWAVSVDGEGTSVAGCPREPICWCADTIGQKTCSQPGEKLWNDWLVCHRAVEMQPGKAVEVLDFELQGPNPKAIRIAPLAMVRMRDDSMRLEAWSNEILGPAYLSIEPRDDARRFDGEWELLLTAGGSKTDLRVSTSRFSRGSEAPRADSPGRIRPASGVDLLPAGLCKP